MIVTEYGGRRGKGREINKSEKSSRWKGER